MKENKLQNKDIAEKLKVSTPYVSQILNGNFNFTLKKLIQLGLMMNKVPYLEFVEPKEYWRREKEGTVQRTYYTVPTIENLVPGFDFDNGGSLPKSHVTYNNKEVLPHG